MNYESIKNRIKEKLEKEPLYGEEEDTRIFNKFFGTAPRYLTRSLIEKYGLQQRRVADMGCGFGSSLAFFGEDSYGFEISKYEVDFARHVGLDAHHKDLLSDDLSEFPKAEVAFSFDVLEHVENPHMLLRKMHNRIEDDGLLILRAPIIPIFPWLRHISFLKPYVGSYLHGDHINAFTPETLQFFCERAGFATIELSPYYPRPFSIFNNVPIMRKLIDGYVYVGRKIAGWEYPENSGKRATEDGDGYVYEGFFQEKLQAQK